MRTYPLTTLTGVALLLIGGLVWLLPSQRSGGGVERGGELVLYCAAGIRVPVERIVAEYQRESGTQIQVQYGGSNTLLSQLEIGKTGDLYLAADESYLEIAKDKGLVAETIPIAWQHAVVAVPKGNPNNIQSTADLLREAPRIALANPDQAAVGKLARDALQKGGQWDEFSELVQQRGVFKPTVGEVANDVKIGSVGAGIVWDTVALQYPELEIVRAPELADAKVLIGIGVLNSSRQPAAALRFARFLTARDQGLKVFGELKYEPVVGDVWESRPELTFFAGAVNRRALEAVVEEFAEREGAEVITVYNGCGILTAQMRTLMGDGAGQFPDAFMACDTYYMDTVDELFSDAVNVSSTPIVLAVAKGNPKQIEKLEDLLKPGVRVALGQPDQCTIGVLSRQVLESAGIYEQVVSENVVTQTTTSSLLVPSITTGAADVALVYLTDTLPERSKLEVVPIDEPQAQAVQPFGTAKSSDHKQLAGRLLEAIGREQEGFESAGFDWRYSPTEAGDE